MTAKSKRKQSTDSAFARVTQLIEDLNAGRRVVVPASQQSIDEGLRQILGRLSAQAGSDSSEDALKASLADTLGADVDVRVLTEGIHRVENGFFVVAGSAHAEFSGSGVALVIGNARVYARGRVSVYGTDHAQLNLYDRSNAYVTGNARVNSYDDTTGTAEGEVVGAARGKSRWHVTGNAQFDTYDSAVVDGDGEARFRVYGGVLHGHGRVKALMFGLSSGWFHGSETEVEAQGAVMVYAHPSARVRVRGTSVRHMPLRRA